MSLVGDGDRERVAASLRRHYVAGRLSDGELADRLELALRARTRTELLVAARALPGAIWDELLLPPARAVGRGMLLLALAAVWSVVSVLLFLAFVVTVVVHGATATTLAGFPLVWALMTWMLWRLSHHGRRSA
jgi:predicted signal transduction protein with EAL and GGDEF domain